MFRRLTLLSLTVLVLPSLAHAARPLQFEVGFDRAVSKEPFTGRVYVLLSRSAIKDVFGGVSWMRPQPFFAVDVKGWKPGTPLVVGADAMACPKPLAKIPKDTYYLQAVMDLDRGGRLFTRSEGNGYSKPVKQLLDPAASGTVRLTIDQVYREPAFKESKRVKLVDVPSKLLTAFHGRPVRMRAAVMLPKSYEQEKDRRYPVVYEIPGFGGSHTMALMLDADSRTSLAGVEFVRVVLDPSCRLGHHVFADSANNGPWGRALVEELIPHVEKTYRIVGKPGARFVTGHSSGGWSSLWLQVTYPDFFGGVWSTAPDPVDFRNFQMIDLYKPGVNVFTDEKGKRRPVARLLDRPVLFFKDMSDMDYVIGRGDQLGSFEAVFSPRGRDGRPRPLWDRKTGKIDPEAVKAWRRYDIRLKLEENWKTLAPKLAGKLHVYVGDSDTFYLEGAVKRLKESLEKLQSDAVVEIVPGKNHSSLMSADMRKRIAGEMAEQYRKFEKTLR
jgi:enterochelin esterase-like enzyme